MDISEKLCPVCKNINEHEAMICVHCGASLNVDSTDGAGETRTTEMQIDVPDEIRESPLLGATVPSGGLAVYVEGIRKPIFSYIGEVFIIGRKVGMTSEALLDLSPWGGYHLGLSRRHAMIRRTETGYQIIDLSSSNGTWLNDQRLLPNKPYELSSGSQLRLGRLKLFILYRSTVENKQKH